MAEELVALGAEGVAKRLRACGTTCEVRTCNTCGDPHAQITVLAGCDVRACVLCARRRAQVETARVGAACDRVAGYVGTRLAMARADVETQARVVEFQPRHTARRDRELARLRRVAGDLRGAHRWAWRMVTLSPPWQPELPESYTPAALARRLHLVRDAWRRLWREHLSVDGYAAAYVSVELSTSGHVHLHALHYGPFVTQKALAATAGMMVDVRAASVEGGVREVVKYALKGPSPRGAWMGGESAETPHPRLAAAWVVATRGRRLVEPYGVMRDALAAVDVCEPVEPDGVALEARCASCGSCDLWEPLRRITAEIARVERLRWSTRSERTSKGDDGRPVPCPPRVIFRRP